MQRADIIQELRAFPHLRAECPSCGGEFRLSSAIIFDPSADLPAQAQTIINRKQHESRAHQEEIKAMALSLRSRKHSATEGAERRAMDVGLGLVVEKLITGWPGFPHKACDCRSLFEPIDYVAFDGMMDKGRVDSLAFIDIKTGGGRLNKQQKAIRDAIKQGRICYKEV